MYRIRLGSAWRVHFAHGDAGLQPPDSDRSDIKFDLPARGEILQGLAKSGSFALRRSFNRPSNLNDEQRVWLTFTSLMDGARIVLNGSVLSAKSATESNEVALTSFEVHDQLRPSNELAIEFESCSSLRSDTIILATVSLDIESDIAEKTRRPG